MKPLFRSSPLLLPLAGLVACGGSESSSDQLEEILIEAGCCCDETTGSDDGGDDGGGDDGIDGEPDALIPLPEVDVGTLCEEGSGAATVELLNVGTATLTITRVEVMEGAGWTVDSYPTTLDASLSGDILLSGGSGFARIEVETDDPNEPIIDVFLHAALNSPPSLSLSNLSPVIAPGGSEDLLVSVSDDAPVTDVQLSVSSDVDGALASASPDSSGDYTYTWDSTVQSAGPHVVTVTATDACGASVTETVTFCQNLGYDASSLDLSTWQFTGSASYDTTNNYVQLTPVATTQAGTAFQTAETVASDNVSIQFSFWMGPNTDGNINSGADGFSVTAIDTSRMTTYQGDDGGAIGYGGLPGWSIEVDTWHNMEPDFNEPTSEDHVALIIDGASGDAGEIYAPLPNMEDSAWHTMSVEVQGQDVLVSIDGTVYLDDTVPALTSFPAHVGFTAATGSRSNEHRIDALTVQNFVCE